MILRNQEIVDECDTFINHDQTANPSIALKLRVEFSDMGCSIIPLGEISHETLDLKSQ